MDRPLSAEEYVALRAAVGWPSPDLGQVDSGLRRSLALVTERDEHGALIGMARAVGDGLYALVVDVVVAPHARSRGLGRRLVQELLEAVEVRSAGHVALFAAPDVVPFYESLGLVAQQGSYLRCATGSVS